MKYSNLILVLIAGLLAAIFIRIGSFAVSLQESREVNQSLAGSCQSLISANHNLEIEMVNLRKQIGELEERFTKK